MHGQSIKEEAKACRALAKRYAGRAEEPFLLKLASTFEELAFLRTASPTESLPSPIKRKVNKIGA